LDAIANLRSKKAKAVLIFYANFLSIFSIPDLERLIGLPVVTINQAAIWCALRTTGVKDDIPFWISYLTFT